MTPEGQEQMENFGQGLFDNAVSQIPIIGDIYSGARQYQMDMEQQRYDRAQTQLNRDREDNAVQRRARDLEAAGLSKTLAAGGAAQAGQVVKSSAPQLSKGTAVQDALGMRSELMGQMKMKQDIARSQEEIKGIRLQNQKQEIENKYIDDLRKGQVLKAQLENQYSAETIQDRIKLVGEKLTGEQINNINKNLDSKLKEQRITTESLNQARLIVENAMKNYKLANLMPYERQKAIEEVEIKRVALDLAKAQSKEFERNVGIFKNLNLPSSGNLGAGMIGQVITGVQSAPGVVGTAVDNISNQVKNILDMYSK